MTLKKLYHGYLYFKYYLYSIKLRKLKIMSIEDTIDYILKYGISIGRYGDGEFKWIEGIKQDSFQNDNEFLQQKLKEVIYSNNDKYGIAIPDSFRSVKPLKSSAKKFWMLEIGKNGKRYLKYLDRNKTYFNANITRFYIDYSDEDLSVRRFGLMKKIWDDKDIIIVEGSLSRLGMGNDLLSNSNSIKRILVPNENAVDNYDNILDYISKNINENNLLLLAIGPTATILSYDLSRLGFQALDVGHIDIEYEWFLNKATSKIPIKNKYTNEKIIIV